MDTARRTVHSAQCTVHSVQCTVYTVHCTAVVQTLSPPLTPLQAATHPQWSCVVTSATLHYRVRYSAVQHCTSAVYGPFAAVPSAGQVPRCSAECQAGCRVLRECRTALPSAHLQCTVECQSAGLDTTRSVKLTFASRGRLSEQAATNLYKIKRNRKNIQSVTSKRYMGLIENLENLENNSRY